MLFWFGADAVRTLRPGTGYDMYYLWPNFLYDLFVVVGVAPAGANNLSYDDIPSSLSQDKHSDNGLEPVEEEDFSFLEPKEDITDTRLLSTFTL